MARAPIASSEQPERVLDLLRIAPGMTVADVGAGTGYFTVRIAKRVGPTGHVLATDVQPEMIAMLDQRIARDKLANVTTIRATEHTAELPAQCCDLVLLVDVYHELADPPGVMAGVKAALKDGGRLALVEYRGEDPDVPIKPVHKMTLDQIRREVAGLGFTFVSSIITPRAPPTDSLRSSIITPRAPPPTRYAPRSSPPSSPHRLATLLDHRARRSAHRDLQAKLIVTR